MSEQKRVTMNNSRQGTARHNDRDGIPNAGHIDTSRTADNRTWICYKDKGMTFEQCEHRYYKNFSKALDARNARYMTQRHPERVKTLEQYLHAEKTRPEECIMQVGTRDMTVDAKTLWGVVMAQLRWEAETFPQVRILNVSMHVDEPQAAPHAHVRRVWETHDRDGNLMVGQNAALKDMGIPLPDPSKPEGRHNNRKMTYTRLCREHLQELCRERGIAIETEPREPGRAGRSLDELKAETARAEVARAERRVAQLERQLADARQELADVRQELVNKYGMLGRGYHGDNHPEKHVQRSGAPELKER